MNCFIRFSLIIGFLCWGGFAVAGEFKFLSNRTQSLENYSFDDVENSFSGDVDFSTIQKISRDVFEDLLNEGVPAGFRGPFKKVCRNSLEIAEKHQIDPFWLLAIMWTESGYRPKAVSRKGAEGLMQIMPGTSKDIVKKFMKGRSHKMNQTAKNIEMGALYLKHLLQIFEGNYVHATAAYNMGPFNVSKRLRKGRVIGSSNAYLSKVTFAYNSLTSHYRQKIRSDFNQVALASSGQSALNYFF
jgi:hypothetical protein